MSTAVLTSHRDHRVRAQGSRLLSPGLASQTPRTWADTQSTSCPSHCKHNSHPLAWLLQFKFHNRFKSPKKYFPMPLYTTLKQNCVHAKYGKATKTCFLQTHPFQTKTLESDIYLEQTHHTYIHTSCYQFSMWVLLKQ